jgi:hypothetical protein
VDVHAGRERKVILGNFHTSNAAKALMDAGVNLFAMCEKRS